MTLKKRNHKYFDEEKREKLDKHFSPEKHGMDRCLSCRGTGKSFNRDEGVKVCSQCGGFGWIRKEGDQAGQSR